MSPNPRAEKSAPALQIDRIACSAHGVCAQILPEQISLDAHGYPIVHDARVPKNQGDVAITMCPARAIYWR